MRIEVLYVPGCPNYAPALARIQQVLASESLQAEVHGVTVSSYEEAKVLLFPGSPTIRIDGDDVEPNQWRPRLILSALLEPKRSSISGSPSTGCFRSETQNVSNVAGGMTCRRKLRYTANRGECFAPE